MFQKFYLYKIFAIMKTFELLEGHLSCSSTNYGEKFVFGSDKEPKERQCRVSVRHIIQKNIENEF